MQQLLDSTITDVTVYLDRAQVSRMAQVELETGEAILVFNDLPLSLDANSVQLIGKGAFIIRDIQHSTTSVNDEPLIEIKPLLEEKKALEVAQKALSKNTDQLSQQKELLQNIVKKLTYSSNELKDGDFDMARWKTVMEMNANETSTLDNQLAAIETKAEAIHLKLLEINHQLLNAGADEAGNQLPQYREVRQVKVLVEATEKTSAILQLSYVLKNASWTPLYDVRANAQTQTIGFQYFGLVSQQTGEDWSDVKLKLSTAKPAVKGHLPEIQAWPLVIYDLEHSKGMMKESAAKPMMSRSADMKKKEMTEVGAGLGTAQFAQSTVEVGATAVFFQLDGIYTIKNGATKSRTTIVMTELKGKFTHHAVPRFSPFAHLKASVKNETGCPILSGNANVFVDGNFVANAVLRQVAINEEFELSLGIDEAIKISHELKAEDAKNQSFLSFNKKHKSSRDFEIKLENLKSIDCQLCIKDHIPYSYNKEVVVQLVEPAIKQNDAALKINENNILEWNLLLKPGEKKVLPVKFTVEHPQELEVEGY